MYILNTLELDKNYSEIGEIVSLKPISEYGLPEEFYGGSVTHIGHVKDSKIKLLINNDVEHMQVVDVASEQISDIEFNALKKYAQARGIPFEWKGVTKDELCKIIEPYVLEV